MKLLFHFEFVVSRKYPAKFFVFTKVDTRLQAIKLRLQSPQKEKLQTPFA